jgi:hypothetical protein
MQYILGNTAVVFLSGSGALNENIAAVGFSCFCVSTIGEALITPKFEVGCGVFCNRALF